jgi:gliding motility-associated-like protein
MNIRLAGFCLLLLLFGRIGFAQDCDNFTITVSADTTLCTPGEPVPVGAVFSTTPFNFQWSPGAGLADPSAAVTTVNLTSTQTYTITAQTIGENLIFNGDFALGNVGFTTDYGQGSGGPNGPLHNEGEYLISNNPMSTHEDFAPCGDHTTGNGNMMVVNSSDQQNDVWCQVVSVTPGTDYAFSAWVASVTTENPANLQFSFDGMLLGNTAEATPVTCEWVPFYATWNSGGATDVEICVTNVNNESTGNDFALDDISFGPVCEATAELTITVGETPGTVPDVVCEANTNSILLSWSPTMGASTYQMDVLDGPVGTFTSDTTYLIEGLTENQQVNYELFAVSAEGCLSHVYSGGCTTLECPDYTLELEGATEICEGSPLDLALLIETESPGPFTMEYTYNGLTNTLPGLQAGMNNLSVPVPGSGSIAITTFSDSSAPACIHNGPFPSLDFDVVPFPAAGVGKDLAFCAALDSLLDLSGILAGADAGGTWAVTAGDVPGGALDASTGQFNLAQLTTSGAIQIAYMQNNGICQPDSAFFNLDILPVPLVETGGPYSLDCDTDEVVVGSPAMAGFAYAWTPLDGGVLSDTGIANPTASEAGDYLLEVTNTSTGCTNAVTLTVADNRTTPELIVSITNPGCTPDGTGSLIVDSVVGGQAPYLFGLNDQPLQQSPSFTGLEAGSYSLRVQDGGGCEGVALFDLESEAPAGFRLFSPGQGDEPIIIPGDSIDLVAQPLDAGKELPDSLVWEPAVCQGCATVRVSPERTTTYTVTGLTSEGCTVTARIVVEVNNVERIYVPTAFSPNNDGINDVLRPYAGPEFVRGVSLRVFNRWGSLVYEASDFRLPASQIGWDGLYKGEPAPSGVYGYHLLVERGNGVAVERSGEVNLIR